MRARWLKPEFFTDKKIGSLEPVHALVYAALWCMADDGGAGIAEPEFIKGQLFYRWSAVGVPDISGGLTALVQLGRIELYEVGENRYYLIHNWERHQAVHKPSKFRHPRPVSGATATTLPHVHKEDSGTSPEPVTDTPRHSPPPRHLDTYTPRHQESASAAIRGEVEGWWPKEYLPDLTDFLDRVLPNETKRVSWLRNLILLKSGERTPPARNPEHMGMGLRAMLANTDRPNWNYYAGCVDNAGTAKSVAPRNAPRGSDDGEALLALGELRQQIVSNTTGHGTTKFIPSEVVNALAPEVRAALEAAGGARKLANVDDEKYGMMAAQFAKAYAAKKQRGTKSEPTRISAILPTQGAA